MVTWISSVEAAQTPLLMVHLKIYTPGIIPVTVDEGFEDVVIAGEFGPLISDQVPLPITGVFPANVVEVTLHKF